MRLPASFHFSQGSLQDYADCRRRFVLRHVEHRLWPAVQAEPVREHEQNMLLGARFHRIVQQFLLGIPANQLADLAAESGLDRWWNSFLAYASQPPAPGCPSPLAGRRFPETSLSACVAGRTLVARYDLILFAPDGRIFIFDWKTSGGRSQRAALPGRMQTRVYPYLLVQAGAWLDNDQPVDPARVEMVYWFAGAPDQPAHFPYSQDRCANDEAYLSQVITEILSVSESDCTPTPVASACRWCTYRSLCARGDRAASLDDPGEPFDLDFDEIDEKAF